MLPGLEAVATTTRSLCAVALVASLAVGPGSAQSVLPRLERVAMPALDSIGPEKAGASIAVSTSGHIAFTGGFDSQNRAVTIVDNAGRVLARLGPRGQGPGELSIPVLLNFAGGELVVLELSARRLSRFSLDGRVQATNASLSQIFLSAASGDSLDVWQWPTSPGAKPIMDFRRISPKTQEGRTLLSGQSAALRALIPEVQQGNSVASIVYAAAGSTVVAANVAMNRLLGIGANESVLFEIHGVEGDTPPKETPLAAIGGLQVDGKNRIWAIGPSQRTGKTAANIYSGSRSLGRLDLPCRGSVTLTGSWMAVLCATPNSTSRDVALQVYRIVD
jgi:hypothetical protein